MSHKSVNVAWALTHRRLCLFDIPSSMQNTPRPLIQMQRELQASILLYFLIHVFNCETFQVTHEYQILIYDYINRCYGMRANC